MNIKRVCVVGCGLMGRQIALNAAIHGYDVALTDNFPEAREAAIKWEEEYLAGRVTKGKMTQEFVAEVKERFAVSPTLEEAAKEADLVIECITEKEDAKHGFFRTINGLVRTDTILATNSSRKFSSLFMDDVTNPERLVNLHYFNPALVMELVEVVQGPHCSTETAQAVMDFAKSVGKSPIWIKGEDGGADGFVVGKINTAILNTAISIVESGYCTVEEVDLACEKGANIPMGPFRLRDLTGIDLIFDMLEEEFQKTGKKPIGYDMFKELYVKGDYGRKSGQGFYKYE